MYSFFAVRFIDHEFDPDDETMLLNVWLTKASRSTETVGWIMLAGVKMIPGLHGFAEKLEQDMILVEL